MRSNKRVSRWVQGGPTPSGWPPGPARSRPEDRLPANPRLLLLHEASRGWPAFAGHDGVCRLCTTRVVNFARCLRRKPTMSGTTAPSPYLPVREDWPHRRREIVLEPELPIVDPHHHLWPSVRAGATCCPTCWPTSTPATTSSPPSSSSAAPMHRARGPRGTAPGRRNRIRQRRRGHERQRRLRPRRASVPALSATSTCASARGPRRCCTPTSRPAADASAASATSPHGMPIRPC